MVYINENSTIVTFAKTNNSKWDRIHFENQITHVAFDLYCADISNSNLVYKVDISTVIDKFEAGQYDYSFIDDKDTVVSSGILQFETFEPATIQYENRIEYIQYTPED